MLWQIVAEDGSGRAVASILVPVAVDDCRSHHDEEVRRLVEETAGAWREKVMTNHRAFIDTRLAREHATHAGRVLLDPAQSFWDPARSADLFQPGLFERRGERAHGDAVAAQAAADRERVERLATIERAGAISFLPPYLLLVLTP
jgi:hypothetical protein